MKKKLILSLAILMSACARSPQMPDEPPIVLPPRGVPQAPVTVYQFSDFQCKPCAEASLKMKRLVEQEFLGQVRLYFNNVPLPQHQWARSAARASIAAAAQGKFWQMHDALFANQKELGPRLYQKLAYDLGLNVIQFENDMKHSRIEAIVVGQAQQAKASGVSGTPTFIINGVVVRGNQKLAVFRKAVRQALEEANTFQK
jgi:protein-disulfide isomerase